ncbi:putative fucosyltransferase-like protein [Apostichopus japonicus]|uniref:Fucosyltransferase n=1 Tax=Stichopus japonicus TaxID=307972 RepID=A0A2G8KQZ6_STIJA|nr:putative fucosyltransferase-like protein [Apostichopus japonicus]
MPPRKAFITPPVQSKPYVVVDNLRYNLTYGYHIKADISQPFGKIVPSEHPSKPTIESKPSDLAPVAWMSSRDHMYWSRSRFVRDLGNYLSIDKYGKMGGKKLPRKGNSSTETLKKYKFYLAFENSCCSHYITEKFWIALSSYEAVPIVVGPSKADYEKVAPPESFIYADDFESFESLAEYVNKVSSTPELYSKFHEWREKYEIKTASKADMFPFLIDSKACTLLEFLRDKAWRQDLPLSPGMDPYGEDWLKSCTPCGKHDWLRQYGLEGNTFLEDLGKKEYT